MRSSAIHSRVMFTWILNVADNPQVVFEIYTFEITATSPRKQWVTIQSIPRADSRLAPCQWETALQSNAVSHWLGANLESALISLSVSLQPDHVPILSDQNRTSSLVYWICTCVSDLSHIALSPCTSIPRQHYASHCMADATWVARRFQADCRAGLFVGHSPGYSLPITAALGPPNVPPHIKAASDQLFLSWLPSNSPVADRLALLQRPLPRLGPRHDLLAIAIGSRRASPQAIALMHRKVVSILADYSKT